MNMNTASTPPQTTDQPSTDDRPIQAPNAPSGNFHTRRNRVALVASVILLGLTAGFGGSALQDTLQKPITKLM
jgi:hypothetical protein